MRHVLVEREDELEQLDRLLTAALSGSGAVAFIAGEAGVGKTRLVAEAASRGRELSLEVLRARGGELEQGLPFGIVRQLFEPSLASQTPAVGEKLFDGAAKLARPVFDLAGPDESGRAEDPSFAVLHGLYWLAANLAARRPLALLIDDAHWADRASRRWLDYLARRIEAVPLLLVVAVRLGERKARDALDELMSSASSSVVRPRSLTARGCARVLQSRWGQRTTPSATPATRPAAAIPSSSGSWSPISRTSGSSRARRTPPACATSARNPCPGRWSRDWNG